MTKRKLYIRFLPALVILLFSIDLSAQLLKAEADRDRIFIGEQINLKLSVVGGREGMPWFIIPDSVNHFEITGRSKIDTMRSGNLFHYTQTISITSFDSGRWDFPALVIAGVKQVTRPIPIDVLPVDVSQMQDYNDIKDIEEVKNENNWLITAIIAAISLLSLIIVYWLFIKKKKVIIAKPVLPGDVTPLQWALSELNRIGKTEPAGAGELKKYYTDLNEVSRKFFELQLQQDALKKTTDEWMVNLQPLTIDADTKTAFFQFLRLSDTVKFAKYQPAERQNKESIEVIRAMLERVALLHSTIYSKYQPKNS